MNITKACAALGRSHVVVRRMIHAGDLEATRGPNDRGANSGWIITEQAVAAALQLMADRQAQAAPAQPAPASSIAAFPRAQSAKADYAHRNGSMGVEDFINCDDWPACWETCRQCREPGRSNGHGRTFQPDPDLAPSAAFSVDLVRQMYRRNGRGGYGPTAMYREEEDQ